MEACIRWRADWCHLANTIEPCMVAMWPFCQIIVTTCLKKSVLNESDSNSLQADSGPLSSLATASLMPLVCL